MNLNNAKGLEKTIASVAVQDDTSIEHLIIDGKSDDDSLAVIKKYSSHITYWVSEKDEGIYHAMNKGIKAANGNYVLFLNSGDTLTHHNVITELQQYTYKVNADIYYTDVFIIDEPARRAYKLTYPKEVNTAHFITQTISHQTAVIRKSLFEEIGYYNENYRMASDWAFFLKAAKNGYSFSYIPHLTLSNFPLHGFSSKCWALGIEERLKIVATEHPEYLANYLQTRKKLSLPTRVWRKFDRMASKYNFKTISRQRRLFNHYQLQRDDDLASVPKYD